MLLRFLSYGVRASQSVPAKSGSGLLTDEHDPQKLPYEEGRTLREKPERERQGNLEGWQKVEQLA